MQPFGWGGIYNIPTFIELKKGSTLKEWMTIWAELKTHQTFKEVTVWKFYLKFPG